MKRNRHGKSQAVHGVNPLAGTKRTIVISAIDHVPCANLLIFKSHAKTDIARVASALALDIRVEALVSKITKSTTCRDPPWKLSSSGQVTATSLRAHVDWILDVCIRPNRDALWKLRGENYWVCVVFHDFVPPDLEEHASIEAELELLDITFDFELERR